VKLIGDHVTKRRFAAAMWADDLAQVLTANKRGGQRFQLSRVFEKKGDLAGAGEASREWIVADQRTQTLIPVG